MSNKCLWQVRSKTFFELKVFKWWHNNFWFQNLSKARTCIEYVPDLYAHTLTLIHQCAVSHNAEMYKVQQQSLVEW